MTPQELSNIQDGAEAIQEVMAEEAAADAAAMHDQKDAARLAEEPAAIHEVKVAEAASQDSQATDTNKPKGGFFAKCWAWIMLAGSAAVAVWAFVRRTVMAVWSFVNRTVNAVKHICTAVKRTYAATIRTFTATRQAMTQWKSYCTLNGVLSVLLFTVMLACLGVVAYYGGIIFALCALIPLIGGCIVMAFAVYIYDELQSQRKG